MEPLVVAFSAALGVFCIILVMITITIKILAITITRIILDGCREGMYIISFDLNI